MKNYEQLMAKVSRALKPGGKLFVHIFAHKTTPYDYEEGWMTEHFFTGGTSTYSGIAFFFLIRFFSQTKKGAGKR